MITLCLYKSVSFLENTHKYLGAKKSIMSTNYSQTAQERIYTEKNGKAGAENVNNQGIWMMGISEFFVLFLKLF